DLERGAEAQAHILQGHAGEKIANRLQRSRGNDRRATGQGVVRKSFRSIAEGDRLLEVIGKPFCRVRRAAWERKDFHWNFAPVAASYIPLSVDWEHPSLAER